MPNNTTSKRKVTDILGWFGVVLILIAFGLVSFGYIAGQSFSFQILNLIGSGLVAYDAFSNKDVPAAVLNCAFVVIAIAAIVVVLKK